MRISLFRGDRLGRVRAGPLLAAATAAVLWAGGPLPCGAHTAHDPADRVLAEIGVDERAGAAVPLSLFFVDQDGRPVRTGDLFGRGPVILTLNYYTCPMLCPITLRNLLSALREVKGLKIGRDYSVATVSIDPSDGPKRAKERAAEIHPLLAGVADPGEAWRFLSGGAAEIEALTRAVGFRYKKVGLEFAHPNVAIVFSPEGKISRYLFGLTPDPADVRLALLEAAQGRIGDSHAMNSILLFCFHYDPAAKRYALYARNIMKAGGAATLVLLGGVYILLWKRKEQGASREGRKEGG